MSAHTDRELIKPIINAQPYAFITKPFEINDLQRGLETTLDRMNSEGFWKESTKHSPSKAINRVPFGFIFNRSEDDPYRSESRAE